MRGQKAAKKQLSHENVGKIARGRGLLEENGDKGRVEETLQQRNNKHDENVGERMQDIEHSDHERMNGRTGWTTTRTTQTIAFVFS